MNLRKYLFKNYIKRAEVFRHLYTKMNSYCQSLGLTFVIVNQITTYCSDGPDIVVRRAGTSVVPSLGPTVTQLTHHRYMLCRRNSTYPALTVADSEQFTTVGEEKSHDVMQMRDLYVLFSPITGARKCSFTVTSEGSVP